MMKLQAASPVTETLDQKAASEKIISIKLALWQTKIRGNRLLHSFQVVKQHFRSGASMPTRMETSIPLVQATTEKATCTRL